MRSPPDRLSAEARRWIGGVTPATPPWLIFRVLAALDNYYDDGAVIRALVRYKRPDLLGSLPR